MKIYIYVFHSNEGYYLFIVNYGSKLEYTRTPPIKRMELLPELIGCIADTYREDGEQVEIDQTMYELEDYS